MTMRFCKRYNQFVGLTIVTMSDQGVIMHIRGMAMTMRVCKQVGYTAPRMRGQRVITDDGQRLDGGHTLLTHIKSNPVFRLCCPLPLCPTDRDQSLNVPVGALARPPPPRVPPPAPPASCALVNPRPASDACFLTATIDLGIA